MKTRTGLSVYISLNIYNRSIERRLSFLRYQNRRLK